MEDFFHTVRAESDLEAERVSGETRRGRRGGGYWSGEVRSWGQLVLDEGVLDDVLLAGQGIQDSAGEDVTSVGHGQGGRSRAVLGLDDFVSSELDAVGQSSDFSIGELSSIDLG